MPKHCPLCHSQDTFSFQSDPFNRCKVCALVFKNPQDQLPPDIEEERYRQHDNRIDNPGYAEFLSPALQEVQKRLPINAVGVDYGCGTNPVLATLLKQAGFRTSYFDPFFFPGNLAGVQNLDFITCTEAAEHFFNPGSEFKKVFSLLKKEGVLVLMTEIYKAELILKDWYYTRDPTHVSFYSEATLKWIAATHHRPVEVISHRLVVFGGQLDSNQRPPELL